MNVKQKIKMTARRYIIIILFSFLGVNLYAGDDVFSSGSGYGLPSTGIERNTDNNTYADNTGVLAYKPFDIYSFSSYNQVLKAPGDRPGVGDGIGVVPVKDDLLFFSLLIIPYILRIRYRLTRMKLKE